jgi:hypothetical protein
MPLPEVPSQAQMAHPSPLQIRHLVVIEPTPNLIWIELPIVYKGQFSIISSIETEAAEDSIGSKLGKNHQHRFPCRLSLYVHRPGRARGGWLSCSNRVGINLHDLHFSLTIFL